MRCLIGLALAAGVALAGCDQLGLGAAGGATNDGARLTEADLSVDDVATGEPGVDRRQWKVESESARIVTGNLTASLPEGRGGPLVLAFANGVTVRLDNIGMRFGNQSTHVGGAALSEILGAEGRAGVFVYRVANERVDAIAPRGGLCGGVRAKHVAAAEFVDADGEWTLRLAAFRGDSAPDPAAAADPDVCAVYAYALD